MNELENVLMRMENSKNNYLIVYLYSETDVDIYNTQLRKTIESRLKKKISALIVQKITVFLSIIYFSRNNKLFTDLNGIW